MRTFQTDFPFYLLYLLSTVQFLSEVITDDLPMFYRYRLPILSLKSQRSYICRIFPAFEGGVIERQTKKKAVLPGLFILFDSLFNFQQNMALTNAS